MDIERIKSLIQLSKETGACEIAVETPDGMIRVVRPPRTAPQAAGAEEAPAAAESERSLTVTLDDREEPLPAGDLVVRSKHVGWFHRGKGPGEGPFVQIGDEVREGQPLATVETLRMSNPVLAPVPGIVKAMLVGEGEEVEYGEELLILTIGAHEGAGDS